MEKQKLSLKDALPRLLANDEKLTCLDSSYKNIGDDGAKALANALTKNSILTELYLGSNGVSSLGAKALAEALSKNSSLKVLNLKHGSIGDEGAKAFADALTKNSTLTLLYLSYNDIGNEGANALADALNKGSSLKQLYLASNKIGDDGAKALSEASTENSTLTLLYLSNNYIGAEGAKALAKTLTKNNTLKQLYLKNNGIFDEGAKAFADALTKNSTLTELYLANDEIGREGGKALAAALTRNRTLKKLDLYNNNIGKDGANALAEALTKNSTLTLLYLSYNDIGDEGANALADALNKSSSLKQLYLASNNIGNEGGKALADALNKNRTLTVLNLDNNNVDGVMLNYIRNILERNKDEEQQDILGEDKNFRGQTVSGDVEQGKDMLDIEIEAIALADTLAYLSLVPPFVLAIFGPWGSGKTFDFGLLRKRFGEIRAMPCGENNPFVGHIYTIKFDVWTYSKADLWSSLMFTILSGLNKQLQYEKQLERILGKEVYKKGVNLIKIMDQLKTSELEYLEGYMSDRDRVLEALKNIDVDFDVLFEAVKGLLSEHCLKELKGKVVKKLGGKEVKFESLRKLVDTFTVVRTEGLQAIETNRVKKKSKKNGTADLLKTLQQAVDADVLVEAVKKLVEAVKKEMGVEFFNEEWWQNKIIKDLKNDDLKQLACALIPKELEAIDTEGGKNISKELVEAVREKDEGNLSKKKKELHRLEVDLLSSRIKKRDKLFCNRGKGSKILALFISGYNNYRDNNGNKLPENAQDLLAEMNGFKKWFTLLLGGEMSWGDWIFVLIMVVLAFVLPIVLPIIFPLVNDQVFRFIGWIGPGSLAIVVSVLKKFNNAFEEVGHIFEQLQSDELLDNMESQSTFMPEERGKMEEITNLRAGIRTITERNWLIQGESLEKVVSERLESSDYEKNLGTVHQAKLDIDRISESMLMDRSGSDGVFPRGKPRIVLFVDDLDRCKPKRVVEMLEALQLLVKTELFVVVVAIDARYVTLCLEKDYEGILHPTDNDKPTGLNYLEKIIQIPYRVPPIAEKKTMRAYLKSQCPIITPTSNGDEKTETNPQVNTEVEVITVVQPDHDDSSSGEQEKKDIVSIVNQYLVEQELTDTEIDVLTDVSFEFEVDPRSAKRILNCYKVMKFVWHLRRQEQQGIDGPDTNLKNAFMLLMAMGANLQFRPIIHNVMKKLQSENLAGSALSTLVISCINGRGLQLDSSRNSLILQCLDGITLRSKVEENHRFRLLRSFAFLGDRDLKDLFNGSQADTT